MSKIDCRALAYKVVQQLKEYVSNNEKAMLLLTQLEDLINNRLKNQ